MTVILFFRPSLSWFRSFLNTSLFPDGRLYEESLLFRSLFSCSVVPGIGYLPPTWVVLSYYVAINLLCMRI